MADLGKILGLLGERNISREVSLVHDRARERYVVDKDTVSSFDEFKDEITKFYRHQIAETLAKIDDAEYVDIMEGQALDIVANAFPSQTGTFAEAYKIASSGIRGGLRTVIDAIYEALKNDMETRYVEHVLRTYVDPLDWDERTQLMEDYVREFGDYLPPGEKMESSTLMATNYEEILRLHAKVLDSMRGHIRG